MLPTQATNAFIWTASVVWLDGVVVQVVVQVGMGCAERKWRSDFVDQSVVMAMGMDVLLGGVRSTCLNTHAPGNNSER